MKPYHGPPMTVGAAAAAQVRLIVWCKACQHQVEPDPAEMAARYGAGTARSRLARAAVLLQNAAAGRLMWWCAGAVARVKCARGPLLPPRPVHSSGPWVGESRTLLMDTA
jgi:hypothetical protein